MCALSSTGNYTNYSIVDTYKYLETTQFTQKISMTVLEVGKLIFYLSKLRQNKLLKLTIITTNIHWHMYANLHVETRWVLVDNLNYK